MPRRALAALAILVLSAAPAAAHLVGPDHPLYDVLRHPVFELPFAAVAIALGLWAGQQKPRNGWAIVAGFVAAVIGGAVAAAHDILPPGRSLAVALAMTAFGALTALRLAAPVWPGLAVALAAGVYLGAFGALPHWQGGTGPYAVSDLAVGALLLPVIVLQLVRRLRAGWVQIAFRVVGSWIAASGILLLALMLSLR